MISIHLLTIIMSELKGQEKREFPANRDTSNTSVEAKKTEVKALNRQTRQPIGGQTTQPIRGQFKQSIGGQFKQPIRGQSKQPIGGQSKQSFKGQQKQSSGCQQRQSNSRSNEWICGGKQNSVACKQQANKVLRIARETLAFLERGHQMIKQEIPKVRKHTSCYWRPWTDVDKGSDHEIMIEYFRFGNYFRDDRFYDTGLLSRKKEGETIDELSVENLLKCETIQISPIVIKHILICIRSPKIVKMTLTRCENDGHFDREIKNIFEISYGFHNIELFKEMCKICERREINIDTFNFMESMIFCAKYGYRGSDHMGKPYDSGHVEFLSKIKEFVDNLSEKSGKLIVDYKSFLEATIDLDPVINYIKIFPFEIMCDGSHVDKKDIIQLVKKLVEKRWHNSGAADYAHAIFRFSLGLVDYELEDLLHLIKFGKAVLVRAVFVLGKKDIDKQIITTMNDLEKFEIPEEIISEICGLAMNNLLESKLKVMLNAINERKRDIDVDFYCDNHYQFKEAIATEYKIYMEMKELIEDTGRLNV